MIQDIAIKTDNVAYYLQRYYSRSLNKVFEAELPEDVKGSQFGAVLKSIVAYLHYKCRVPQNKIHDLLTDIGVVISEGTISNILTGDKANEFFAERMSILEAGMLKSKYLQADESGARHNGRNCYLHVICNDMFSFFTIKDSKSRSTITRFWGWRTMRNLRFLLSLTAPDNIWRYQSTMPNAGFTRFDITRSWCRY